jgi:phosphohistidine swiveling domain-containing protein
VRLAELTTAVEGGPVEEMWKAPGDGFWELELLHFPRPVPWCFQRVFADAASQGLGESLARYGVPLLELRFEYVHDRMYQQVVPVMDADELARRSEVATAVYAERRWRQDARVWRDITLPARVATNLERQRVDLTALDDAALDAELTAVLDNLRSGVLEHMRLVFAVDSCVGDYVARADEWGVSTDRLLRLLVGTSPLAREAARLLAAGDVDGFRELHGWRSPAYDPSVPTLGEHPEALALALAAATSANEAADARTDADTTAAIQAVRAAIPAARQGEFDELLTEAQLMYGVRDENESPCLLWPVGLVRRVLLEIGTRLVERGQCEECDDVFFADRSELSAAVGGDSSNGWPGARAVAERRRMARARSQHAPLHLGDDPGPPPPPEAFPEGMRRVARATMILAGLEYATTGGVGDDGVLAGDGIGEAVYRGRVCLATSPADAFDRLREGDVLVITCTNSALDPVLAIAGALVVEEGGPWTHAAIVARELGLPTVVGARGALQVLTDGETVEVDCGAGRVRRVASPVVP